MTLNLSANQSFTPIEGISITPMYSNWEFRSSSNVGFPMVIFMKNSPESSVLFYELKPRQGYQSWVNEGYTNLKIKHQIVYPPGISYPVHLTSPLIPEMNYTATSGDTWYAFQIAISPNLTTPLGLNIITVKLFIEGMKNGEKFVLSTYDFPIRLHVLDEGYYYSPLDFTFLKSNNVSPAQSFAVGGNNWEMNVPNGLFITSQNAAIQSLDSGGYYVSGSGSTYFKLSLATNISQVLGSNVSIDLPITIKYSGVSHIVPVKVIQTGDVYPTYLDFYIASGVIDKEYQDLVINKSGNVVFDVPSYLNARFIEIQNKRILRISVLDPENLGNGVYVDDIHLTIGNTSSKIPVKVSVSNAFDIGIENEEVNFTRSMNDLFFYSNNENTFVELKLKQQAVQREFFYRIPFIEGKCTKNIGLVLDRTLDYDNKSNLMFSSEIPVFTLNISEKKSNMSVLEFEKANIPYVKGYKPKVVNKSAILHHNDQSRYTSGSFALVSIMSLTGVYMYAIRKNGEIVYQSSNLYGYLCTLKIDFSDYNVRAGDLVEFVLITENEELVKKFVIFPDQETSLDIVYLDSFGLKSVINFTGNAKKVLREINNVYETMQVKTYFHQRKLKVSEEKKLTLNTGFLLKSQILEVDELIDSSMAWLYVNGEKKMTIVPVTDKITTLDSDDFTVSYLVEFVINTEKYAQDYTI